MTSTITSNNTNNNNNMDNKLNVKAYQGWKEGDIAVRKGRLCTIKKIDFLIDPPCVSVKMHDTNDEVGTEFDYLSKPTPEQLAMVATELNPAKPEVEAPESPLKFQNETETENDNENVTASDSTFDSNNDKDSNAITSDSDASEPEVTGAEEEEQEESESEGEVMSHPRRRKQGPPPRRGVSGARMNPMFDRFDTRGVFDPTFNPFDSSSYGTFGGFDPFGRNAKELERKRKERDLRREREAAALAEVERRRREQEREQERAAEIERMREERERLERLKRQRMLEKEERERQIMMERERQKQRERQREEMRRKQRRGGSFWDVFDSQPSSFGFW